MIIKKITKQYGDCEVTISFNGYNTKVKDKILWLLLESYHDRIKKQPEQIYNDVTDKKAS